MKISFIALPATFLLLGSFSLGMSENSSLSYDVVEAKSYVNEYLSSYYVDNELTRDEVYALDVYDSCTMYSAYLLHGLLPEQEQFSIEKATFEESREKFKEWDIFGEIQYPWQFVKNDVDEIEIVPTNNTSLYNSESIIGLAETLMLYYGNFIKYQIIDDGIIGEGKEYYINPDTQKEEITQYITGYVTMEIEPLDVFQGMTREELDGIYYDLEKTGDFETKEELIHAYLHNTLRLLVTQIESGKDPIYKDLVTENFEIYTSHDVHLMYRSIESDYMFLRDYDQILYDGDESLRLLSTLMDFYPSEE